ncbi:MAG: aldehyde dehydrogenase family protein [Deltaproteobacteria bacterium]|jgi:acetaldehyde dehydrogenase (acetylating)
MKTFYTERDIENLVQAGVSELEIDEDTVLTDLAREMVTTLGLRLKPVAKRSVGLPQPRPGRAGGPKKKVSPAGASISPAASPSDEARRVGPEGVSRKNSTARGTRENKMDSEAKGAKTMNQEFDSDLRSMQEARDLVERGYKAQQEFLDFSQEQVDRICEAMVEAAYRESERLGRMAFEESGYGVAEHKTLKNQFASRTLWRAIKDVRTVGVIRDDRANGIMEIAWPMGVVVALIPSTNPTSTIMSKTIPAVKARNAIVLAPHPSTVHCCVEAQRVMVEAGEAAGMPPGLVSIMTRISLPGTQELMRHRRTSLILATGGIEMVRVAHSMGKPTIGVGPGNVPAYVDRSADVNKAANYIVSSKSFDNSLICASEQAVVADRPIAAQLKSEMERLGAYFVTPEQTEALRRFLFLPNGAINVPSVGLPPQSLARKVNITVPDTARILVAKLDKVGKEEPLSAEKLTTVLAWYEVDGWEAGCERCVEILKFGGLGHTLVIHATDEKPIMEFGLKKPVFRILVNTLGTTGAVGLTTELMPTMTVGSGGVGGSITGDNIGVYHLFNIKRVAYETKSPPSQIMAAAGRQLAPQPTGVREQDRSEVERIVRMVLTELDQRP